MYIYETHCHCNLISKCSRFSPEEIVETFVKNGYSGVFITDHFINGNCVDELRYGDYSYREKIEKFCDGYRKVKEIAKDDLQVFFGFEYSYKGTDVLIYGWDEDKLKSLKEVGEIQKMSDFIRFANDNGALTIQAHPFREASYIDHIRLYPEVMGIEVFNACRDDRTNRLADNFSNEYDKIKFSGSDIHIKNIEWLGGMAFDDKIKNEQDFVEKIKQGKGRIYKQRNILGD